MRVDTLCLCFLFPNLCDDDDDDADDDDDDDDDGCTWLLLHSGMHHSCFNSIKHEHGEVRFDCCVVVVDDYATTKVKQYFGLCRGKIEPPQAIAALAAPFYR